MTMPNIQYYTFKLILRSLIVWQAGKWNLKDNLGAHALDLKNNVADFSGTPLTMSVKRAECLKYIIHAWPFR